MDDLAEYMTYCCAARGNGETMIAGNLVAGNFFHEQWVRRSLALDYLRIKAVKGGIKRAHVEGGTKQRVKKPLSWEMLKRMEEAAKEWGVSERMVLIRMALAYLILLRA